MLGTVAPVRSGPWWVVVRLGFVTLARCHPGQQRSKDTWDLASSAAVVREARPRRVSRDPSRLVGGGGACVGGLGDGVALGLSPPFMACHVTCRRAACLCTAECRRLARTAFSVDGYGITDVSRRVECRSAAAAHRALSYRGDISTWLRRSLSASAFLWEPRNPFDTSRSVSERRMPSVVELFFFLVGLGCVLGRAAGARMLLGSGGR